MTDQPPESPRDGEGEEKFYAKRRLPFDQLGQGRHPGLTAAAFLYAAATLACFGLAAYMAFAQNHPVASVPVIAPIAGGIWFFIRLLMVLRPQIKRD